MSRSVVVELAERMASERRRGESFEPAWRRSLEDVLRLVSSDEELREWKAALQSTKRSWRAAYKGEVSPHTAAVAALAAAL